MEREMMVLQSMLDMVRCSSRSGHIDYLKPSQVHRNPKVASAKTHGTQLKFLHIESEAQHQIKGGPFLGSKEIKLR